MSYHDYVFQGGKPVHDFEAMYANEDAKGYDSWKQGDLRHTRVQIAQTLIAPYNFATVLDIGCGKGAVTQLLKRANNHVVAVDISATAIAKARASFPDIHFACSDALTALRETGERFDLVSIQGVLSYVPEWRECIREAARVADYFLSVEYVPAGTLGATKSTAEIIAEIATHFGIVHSIVLDGEVSIVLARSIARRA